MSSQDAQKAMRPLIEAVFGRAREGELDAILAHDLLVTLVAGMRGGDYRTRYEGWPTNRHIVSTCGRYLGDGAHAAGVSYTAAAVVLVASRVEEGVWGLTRTVEEEPWDRGPGLGRPVAPTEEPLRAVASVLLASGWAEVLRS